MTTTTRNEAAERLRLLLDDVPTGGEPWRGSSEQDLFREALAAERRATVERIRAAVRNAPRDEGPPVDRGSRFMVEVYRILDEEAAR